MTAWNGIVANFVRAEVTKPKPTVPATHKFCKRCKETKPRSEFYPRKSHSEGAVVALCKPCHSAATRERESRLRQERKQLRAEYEAKVQFKTG